MRRTDAVITPASVATPAVVVDAARVRENIRRLAAYAGGHRIKVRPHTKTHKGVELARLQLAAGASGLTVAKVGEAEALLPAFDGRAPDILVAYPVVDVARTQRIASLARETTIRVALDTAIAIEAVGAAAREAGTSIGVLVDLDVGMGRTGVSTPDSLASLAQVVERSSALRLDGIFCYPGHVWAKSQEQAAPLALVAAIVCTVVSDAVGGQVVLDGGSKTFTSDRCIPAERSGLAWANVSA